MRKISCFVLALLCSSASDLLRSDSPAANTAAKRPMTFEDMMADEAAGRNRRLARRQVAGVLRHTVDLEQEHQNAGAVAAGDRRPQARIGAIKLAVAQPGDSGSAVFARRQADSLSSAAARAASRSGSRTSIRRRARRRNAKKLTAIATEADNAKWSPDGQSIVFTVCGLSGLPGDHDRRLRRRATSATPTATAAADSKVKAQIFTHLLYRHWNHYTGDKRSHLFLVSVDGGANARPQSRRSARRSAVFARGLRAAAATFRPTRRNWRLPRISIRSRRSRPARRSTRWT